MIETTTKSQKVIGMFERLIGRLHILFDHNLQNPDKQVEAQEDWDVSEDELFSDPNMSEDSLVFNAEIHVREYIESKDI